MTKVDYAIALAAIMMAMIAAALWFTREPSIALEDAPPIARQLVSEMGDPDVQDALAKGRPIRVRALTPDKDLPVFHPPGVSARDYMAAEARSEACAKRLAASSGSGPARPAVQGATTAMPGSAAQAAVEAEKAATAAGASAAAAASAANCRLGGRR